MPDEKGIRCRKCGCRHFFVIRTQQGPGERVMRVRECRHCQQRLVTYEAAAGEKVTPAIADLTQEQQESLLTRLLQLVGIHAR